MFPVKYFFFLISIDFIVGRLHLNLYYTDVVSENDEILQHTCLQYASSQDENMNDHQVMSYCMNELSSKFKIEKNIYFPNFTFAELQKRNMSSQDLYLWSAPIDIIEHYQFYLNQSSSENNLSLSEEIYYNCTIPRFGPLCQYQLSYNYSHDSSLDQIIYDYHKSKKFHLDDLTCYIHLKCNHGLFPSCLSWNDICNGEIDCLDNGLDEEHCWQLEIHQCEENEYQCTNGQCIPKSFYRDNNNIPDCLDASDVAYIVSEFNSFCWGQPWASLRCDDISCPSKLELWSCDEKRSFLLAEAMQSNKESSFSPKCWSTVKCVFNFTYDDQTSCHGICEHDECIQKVEDSCPDMLYFPNVPILFDNVYFAYKTNELRYWTNKSNIPFYICYETSQYDDHFVNVSKIFVDNMTCVDAKPFLPFYAFISNMVIDIHSHSVNYLRKQLKRYHLSFNYTSTICNRSNMYQCNRSLKCISIRRLMNNVSDCPHMDDENMEEISKNYMEYLKKNFYKCMSSGKYIHASLVEDTACDCGWMNDNWCEEEDLLLTYRRKNILFQHICDGLPELLPILIDERNETDETECKQWPCNNIYSRCYNDWNCPIGGGDKNSCTSHSVSICSSENRLCVSPDQNQFICLPMEKMNDGNVDCLGGTDELILHGMYLQAGLNSHIYSPAFYCMNQGFKTNYLVKLCDGINDCNHGDDEQFCTANKTYSKGSSICLRSNFNISKVEEFLCNYTRLERHSKVKYFLLDGMNDTDKDLMGKYVFNSDSSRTEMFDQNIQRCRRGIGLLVWLTNNLTQHTCLCPSSFYGDQCQYQNERVSLTVKFLALASSLRIPFAIVISLIDDSDRRITHSYEQFTYLSVRDCQMKFHSYLLYSTKPKDLTKNYSIHIDIYEKFTLTYRGSLLFPVQFPFLPIQRHALIANIPRSNDKNQLCIDKKCIHGKCIKYSNNPSNIHFCQCDPGWSGRYCTIEHRCTCASDSLCLGFSADNRSICVCPMNKFGSRCLLTDSICERNDNSTCQNGGQCISNIDSKLSNEDFVCICRKGFSGNRCEIADNKLILSFGNDITISREIFIHFIDIFSMRIPEKFTGRATTFRRIPFQHNSVIVYWPDRFHLVFTELFNKTYYLTVAQTIYKESTTIIRTINSSDRCPPISELFNESFVKSHLLRRIKYYHLPCQNQSLNLSCFYDEIHFCLCYEFEEQRLANCFQFDHDKSYDCSGQNECENGGRCLQNRRDCPTASLCQCLGCFYGSRCQFRTDGFGLSLDAIIGYHIFPNISLNQQPIIIKMSLSLVVIFIILGVLNGICCIMTFQNKSVRTVGCGLYLLCSSITTLFLMIIFGLKFVILLLAQMAILSNRSFLEIQCHSVDFILQVCLSLDQWLNACVAVERAVTTMKGAGFVKKKSKQAAKYVIISLLIVAISTCIHDPIYRYLIDEENDGDDEKRIWCIVTYPSSLQIYNSLMNIFHFCGPFILNLVSSTILITKKSRQQSNLHPDRKYKEILRQQFREHKNLLTAPIALVIVALPRLILTAISKCMKSDDEPWLFFIAYFIPFIAPMLTFIIFVIPSKFYMKEFRKTLLRYRTTIQESFHWISLKQR